MITKFNKYINEGLTDKMIGKSDEEINKALDKITNKTDKFLKQLELGLITDITPDILRMIITLISLDARRSNILPNIIPYISKDSIDDKVIKLLNNYTISGMLPIKTINKRIKEVLAEGLIDKITSVPKEIIDDNIKESLRDKMTPKSEKEIQDKFLNMSIENIRDTLYDVYKNDPPKKLVDKILNKFIKDFDVPDFNKETKIDILNAIVFIYNHKPNILNIEERCSFLKPHSLASINNKYTYVTGIAIGSPGYNSNWFNVRVLPKEEKELTEFLNKWIDTYLENNKKTNTIK